MPRQKKQTKKEPVAQPEMEEVESPSNEMEDPDSNNPGEPEETVEEPLSDEPLVDTPVEDKQEPQATPDQEAAIKRALESDGLDEAKRHAATMDRLRRARELFLNAKNARRKYDREWLSRDLFRRGYHYINQNNSTGAVSISASAKARIPINLTWAYIRSITNQVTSFNPKWEVMPEFKGKTSEQNARLAGKLLDYLFVKWNMRRMIREAVIQGLIYSVGGPFEVVWNPNYDNGPNQPRGEVEIILHDPFDIYIDPRARSLAEAEFIVKAVRTSIKEIKANPDYDAAAREAITGGSQKKAESEYKQFLIQTVQNNIYDADDNEGVILKEIQWKERDQFGQIQIRFLTWVDEYNVALRDELVDQEDFDMEVFQADQNPLELYGDSWAKHVMALNRAMNSLESSIFEYNYRYAKGRLVVDKNSGVRAITNEHGSIIEKNRGAEVRPLPLQPLPSSVESQVVRLKAMMEDISGVHETTLGRTPTGIKSGIGIAELKQSDSSNQDDLVQNLESCLMRLGRKILKKIAENYDSPRIIKVVGTGRMVDHFAVVGEDYVDKDKKDWKIREEKYPLARISKSNELNVTIGSWLAYTKEARQNTLMDMAKAGIIGKEDLLKYLEFPDVQEVVDRARAESVIELKRKEDAAAPSGISQEQLALSENEMMLEGQMMPVDPTDDHNFHIAIHMSALGKDGDNRTVSAHIAEHRRNQKGGGEQLNVPLPDQALAPPGMQVPGGQPTAPPAPPMPPPMLPAPPQGMSMPPPGMPPQGMQPLPPPPPPVQSYFSAGVQEIPPTASTVLGGASNSMPIG